MTRTEEEKAAVRKAGFGITPDGRAVFGYKEGDPVPPGIHQISLQDARNPIKYQQARAEAAEAGATLQIVDPNAHVPPPPDPDAPKSNFTGPEPVRITRTQAQNLTTYRMARDQAQRDGVPFEIVDDPVTSDE